MSYGGASLKVKLSTLLSPITAKRLISTAKGAGVALAINGLWRTIKYNAGMNLDNSKVTKVLDVLEWRNRVL